MKTNRAILEEQLESCEDKLKGFGSYVEELKTVTAKHGTPKDQYESDLIEAAHNIGFYESEIARIKKEMGTVPSGGGKVGTGPGTLLPQTMNQGIGAAILSSISFVVGALLGSRLKSKKSSNDR
ncbi:MAG: hypothetical protein ACR2HX_12775 [Pyrinomonadaceae bacterium]